MLVLSSGKRTALRIEGEDNTYLVEGMGKKTNEHAYVVDGMGNKKTNEHAYLVDGMGKKNKRTCYGGRASGTNHCSLAF